MKQQSLHTYIKCSIGGTYTRSENTPTKVFPPVSSYQEVPVCLACAMSMEMARKPPASKSLCLFFPLSVRSNALRGSSTASTALGLASSDFYESPTPPSSLYEHIRKYVPRKTVQQG